MVQDEKSENPQSPEWHMNACSKCEGYPPDSLRLLEMLTFPQKLNMLTSLWHKLGFQRTTQFRTFHLLANMSFGKKLHGNWFNPENVQSVSNDTAIT